MFFLFLCGSEEIVLAVVVVVIAFVSIVVVGSVDSSYYRDRGSCGGSGRIFVGNAK